MRRTVGCLLFLWCLNANCNDDVSLTLVGYVTPKCGFTAKTSNLILSSDGFANTELVINCNSPMQVSLRSINGGLRHQQDMNIKDYNVKLAIKNASYRMSASSSSMKLSKKINVDDILFNSMAELQIELVEPLIYAGIYQDVIRIEMTPTAVSGGVR